MRSDECADFDLFWDDKLCAAARRHFRGHLGSCRHCQEELHTRIQLSVITGLMRRPRLPDRLLELARTVRDVAPVVLAYSALAVVVGLRGGWDAAARKVTRG